MRLHWTFGSLPELGHLAPKERREVLRRARATPVWIGMIVRAALWGLLLGGATGALLQTSGASETMSIACSSVAVVIVSVVEFQVQFLSQRGAMRREIMQSLRGQRLPVCLKCGYNQSGNATDRCPECGAPTRVPLDER